MNKEIFLSFTLGPVARSVGFVPCRSSNLDYLPLVFDGDSTSAFMISFAYRFERC